MRTPLKVKTDYLNILLDLAAQRTRERGDRAYERVLGMPLRDVRLLRIIGTQPGISMGALSDGSGLEKTLASKVIGSLVKRGLVERQIGRKDARNVHLMLTEAPRNGYSTALSTPTRACCCKPSRNWNHRAPR